jgi:hypothetical protein
MAHGEPFPGRLGRSRIPPDALGSGSSAGHRLARDRLRAGCRDAPGRPNPTGPTGRSGSGDRDRLRRTRCDHRPGRNSTRCRGRPGRRSFERPDHARPAPRGRGPGRWFDRRLGGPCPEPGSGRGGDSGSPAGVAGRARAGLPGRRSGNGRLAPDRAVRRCPRARPARGRPGGLPAGPDSSPTSSSVSSPASSSDRTGRVPERSSTQTPTEPGQPPRTPQCAGPARRRLAHRPRATRPGAGPRCCRRLVHGPAARAGPPILDPARPRCRRPADRGGDRSEPVRPDGPPSGASDPVRRRWQPGCLPPARLAPVRPTSPGDSPGGPASHGRARGDRPWHGRHDRRPHQPVITDSRSCDVSTSSGRICRSVSPGLAPTRSRPGR